MLMTLAIDNSATFFLFIFIFYRLLPLTGANRTPLARDAETALLEVKKKKKKQEKKEGRFHFRGMCLVWSDLVTGELFWRNDWRGTEFYRCRQRD